MNSKHGFTLLELMIVLSISAIILLASNAFSQLLFRNQISTTVQNVLSSLHYARNEAITRSQRVTMCKSDTTTTPLKCRKDQGESGWQHGWIVFVDVNNDQQIEDPEHNILRVFEAIPPRLQLKGNSPVQDYVSYLANGLARKTSGSIQMGSLFLCKNNGIRAKHKNDIRQIIISSSGRARVGKVILKPGDNEESNPCQQ